MLYRFMFKNIVFTCNPLIAKKYFLATPGCHGNSNRCIRHYYILHYLQLPAYQEDCVETENSVSKKYFGT